MTICVLRARFEMVGSRNIVRAGNKEKQPRFTTVLFNLQHGFVFESCQINPKKHTPTQPHRSLNQPEPSDDCHPFALRFASGSVAVLGSGILPSSQAGPRRSCMPGGLDLVSCATSRQMGVKHMIEHSVECWWTWLQGSLCQPSWRHRATVPSNAGNHCSIEPETGFLPVFAHVLCLGSRS